MDPIYLVAAAGFLVLILVAVMVMKKGKAATEEPEEHAEKWNVVTLSSTPWA